MVHSVTDSKEFYFGRLTSETLITDTTGIPIIHKYDIVCECAIYCELIAI